MFLNMSGEVRFPGESFFTYVALHRMLSRVRCQVPIEATFSSESATTRWAFQRLLSGVHQSVILHISLEGEPFFARFTLKRFFSGVSSKMPNEVTSQSERHIAIRARMGFVSSMRQHVLLYVRGPREARMTHGTEELFPFSFVTQLVTFGLLFGSTQSIT